MSSANQTIRRMRVAIVVVIGAAFVLVAPPADAGKRSVVLLKSARGAKTRVCRNLVKTIISSKHNVNSPRKYMRTRAKMRRFGFTARNVAAVSTATGTDALVHVRIAYRYRKATLVVRVRAGKTGKIADTLYIPMRRGRCTARTGKSLRNKLLSTLAWVEPIDEESDPEPPKPTEQVSDEPTPEPTPSGDEPSVRTSVETKGGGSSALGAIGGSIDVGFSAIGRRMEFTTSASIPAAMQPRWYNGRLVGGVHVDAELYPFMHKEKPSQISRIGVVMSMDQSVSMKSTLSANGMDQQFATNQSRWGVGVRYRIPIGKGALKLGAGYDQLTFAVDSGAVDTGLPNVGYSYVDVGGSVELPFTSWLGARAGGRYLHVMQAGDIAAASAYGQANVTGMAGEASLNIKLTSKLQLRAGISFLRIAFDFDGSGQMTDLDADSQQDVGGASDTYTGGFVSAGYYF